LALSRLFLNELFTRLISRICFHKPKSSLSPSKRAFSPIYFLISDKPEMTIFARFFIVSTGETTAGFRVRLAAAFRPDSGDSPSSSDKKNNFYTIS
jgi:hypothetical protein